MTQQATITLAPSGGDDTAQINAALAALGPTGGELVLSPGGYTVPNGIQSTAAGIHVRGLGSRGGSAGTWEGAVLVASNPGAWCWQQLDPSTTSNEYRGCRFDNVTFQGNSVTAGGLLLRTNYNTVFNCGAVLHSAGIGFQTLAPALPSGKPDASWNIFQACFARCHVGYQLGAADMPGASSGQLIACINLGISGATDGFGVIVYDNNCSIIGGKFESNGTGILNKTSFLQVLGARYEANAAWDVDLYRDSGTSFTSNLIVGTYSKLRVGPFNIGDTVIGGEYPHTVTDLGQHTVNIGEGRVKCEHLGAVTPTGGLSGEIKVGTGGVLWVNDRGTWVRK